MLRPRYEESAIAVFSREDIPTPVAATRSSAQRHHACPPFSDMMMRDVQVYAHAVLFLYRT
jgi:hypothetical protein